MGVTPTAERCNTERYDCDHRHPTHKGRRSVSFPSPYNLMHDDFYRFQIHYLRLQQIRAWLCYLWQCGVWDFQIWKDEIRSPPSCIVWSVFYLFNLYQTLVILLWMEAAVPLQEPDSRVRSLAFWEDVDPNSDREVWKVEDWKPDELRPPFFRYTTQNLCFLFIMI